MLKIYHKYLLRKTVIAFVVSQLIISACLVCLNLLKLVKNSQFALSFGLFTAALGYLNLFLLAFSVPLSILIAALLVYGKLSADNEVTAFRASGIRITQISMPAIVLAVLASLGMLYINGVVSPRGHYSMSRLEFLAGSIDPMILFRPREKIPFGDYSILIDRIEGNKMFDIRLMEPKSEGTTKITAKWAELLHRPGDSLVTLNLYDTDVSIPSSGGDKEMITERDRLLTIEFDLKKLFRSLKRGKGVDDLTMKELVARRKVVADQEGYAIFKILRDLNVENEQVDAEDDSALDPAIIEHASAAEAIRRIRDDARETRMQYTFEINKRLVLSASCFALAMIAIPLGISFHRRERTVNVLIGVVVALVYYLVILTVEKSLGAGALKLWMIWLPPLVCVLLGSGLFYRLRRGA